MGNCPAHSLIHVKQDMKTWPNRFTSQHTKHSDTCNLWNGSIKNYRMFSFGIQRTTGVFRMYLLFEQMCIRTICYIAIPLFLTSFIITCISHVISPSFLRKTVLLFCCFLLLFFVSRFLHNGLRVCFSSPDTSVWYEIYKYLTHYLSLKYRQNISWKCIYVRAIFLYENLSFRFLQNFWRLKHETKRDNGFLFAHVK
jgi:hypothetical protein